MSAPSVPGSRPEEASGVQAALGRQLSGSGRLIRLGFVDAGRAERELVAMGLAADDPIAEAVAAGADPDQALTSLGHIYAADPAVLELLRADQVAAERLVAVLGASSALGAHLARYPGDCRLLTAQDLDVEESDLGYLPPVQDPDALRVAHRQGLLRIGALDLTGEISMDRAADHLSDLAAQVLKAALAMAVAEQPEPVPDPVPLAVIAMGKCGARELNYISDVDVIFVAGDESELPLATHLAEATMRICSATTSEGKVFEVDAGLRPEGRQGPLVRTLASCEAYYHRWARTWEFQALLKARPVAGDAALGLQFREFVDPLVWSVAQRPGFVSDVQEMRRRVEKLLPRSGADRDLKLGPGGLRDVEFAVQLLQLVHGRNDPSLHEPATLPALTMLAAGGYIGRFDAEQLADAYRFLRTLEHRLQLHRLQRTHMFPADEPSLRWLGRSLGMRTEPERRVVEVRAEHARQVRRLHEKLFYRPLLDAVARLPAEQARLSSEAARERLVALGFTDPASALKHLQALTTGVSRSASIQRTLLPAMLEWFAGAADPDAGLLAYRQVSEALGRTPWFLRLLRDEGAPGSPAAQRLATLLASSHYLAGLIARAPESVMLLRDDDQLELRDRGQVAEALLAVVRRNDQWESAVMAARGVRRVELVRIAAADLLGLADVQAVGSALSAAAAATVQAALEVAIRKVRVERRGVMPVSIAVIAMGRLGGYELGYSSDADVLFVHEARDGATDVEAAAIAADVAEELRRLLALPAPDPPLLIDAGLRPEGRQGPLSRSLASYQSYYSRWSLGWEAQALLRASHLAGDADLGVRFLHVADDVRYPATLRPAAISEIARLKQRMQTERLPKGVPAARHVKLGPGGLTDVEWAAQILQLRHAHELPQLRTTATLEALDHARDAGFLSAQESAALTAGWTLATRIRNAIMLVTGRPGDLLPSDGRPLDRLARALGYSPENPAELLTEQRQVAGQARAVVDDLFAREVERG
jgi:glutamate-ammonia-ligase adenylyltransferase